MQIVPYLICISTDAERVSHAADKQLQEIEKKYPGFIHMKALQGIRLSYQLQSLIESAPKENSPVQSASKYVLKDEFVLKRLLNFVFQLTGAHRKLLIRKSVPSVLWLVQYKKAKELLVVSVSGKENIRLLSMVFSIPFFAVQNSSEELSCFPCSNSSTRPRRTLSHSFYTWRTI